MNTIPPKSHPGKKTADATRVARDILHTERELRDLAEGLLGFADDLRRQVARVRALRATPPQ